MRNFIARLSTILGLVLVLTACSSAPVSPSTAPDPTLVAPSFAVPISTPEDAMAAVVAADPRFADIPPRDLDLIGQSAWWEAKPASGVGAFVVSIYAGWGDCQAGCIDDHTWTYAVTPDGAARLLTETGPSVPPDVLAEASDGQTGMTIHAVAGPACPAVTNPPDPACAPRPVIGATILIRDASGTTTETTTDAAGSITLELPAGDYEVTAEPVDGLMGTPETAIVTVFDGDLTTFELEYDTGIR